MFESAQKASAIADSGGCGGVAGEDEALLGSDGGSNGGEHLDRYMEYGGGTEWLGSRGLGTWVSSRSASRASRQSFKSVASAALVTRHCLAASRDCLICPVNPSRSSLIHVFRRSSR